MKINYKYTIALVLITFAINACGPLAPYQIANLIVKVQKATGNCKDCK